MSHLLLALSSLTLEQLASDSAGALVEAALRKIAQRAGAHPGV